MAVAVAAAITTITTVTTTAAAAASVTAAVGSTAAVARHLVDDVVVVEKRVSGQRNKGKRGCQGNTRGINRRAERMKRVRKTEDTSPDG